MSFVVTGATGRLGRGVVEHLLERGVAPDDVVATGRDADRLAALEALGVRVRRADFDDPATFDGLYGPGDLVLLVSGSTPGDRLRQHGVAIEAAVAAGVARLVYTSAPHAGSTGLVLAPEHRATEELLASTPLTTTVLRNNWYHENYVPTLEQARRTGRIVGNAGAGGVASASRRDYAEAAAIVLSTDGHDDAVYELAGDRAWDHDELAAVCSQLTGREIVYQPVEAAEALSGLVGAGVDEGTARFVVALDANTAAGDLADADPTLARLLGRPTTPLLDGLRAATS